MQCQESDRGMVLLNEVRAKGFGSLSSNDDAGWTQIWGAPRIHGELLKLGFVVSQATVSRYMPRRDYPPHSEVAHLPEEPSICHRCDRFRRSRSAIRRRPRMDHASWPVRHQSAGWHPLQAYRAIVDLASVVAMSLFQSCRSALHPKALRARLLRGPPLKAAPIGLGQSTTFTVSLKGITETQAARHSAHDHPLSRAEPSGRQFLYGDCTVRLPRTIRNTAKSLLQKSKDLQSLSLPGDPAAIRLSRTRL